MSNTTGDELVVCVAAHNLKHLFAVMPNSPPGFIPASSLPLSAVVNLATATHDRVPVLLPRSRAETDEQFKHLITYTMINCYSKYMTYQRGKSGGEGRLHAKRSLGVGGHVTAKDVENGVSEVALAFAAYREVEEEVDLSGLPALDYRYVGMLVDDSNSVGRVHLGLIFSTETKRIITSREDCLEDVRFESRAALILNRCQYESWSQILIDLLAQSPPGS